MLDSSPAGIVDTNFCDVTDGTTLINDDPNSGVEFDTDICAGVDSIIGDTDDFDVPDTDDCIVDESNFNDIVGFINREEVESNACETVDSDKDTVIEFIFNDMAGVVCDALINSTVDGFKEDDSIEFIGVAIDPDTSEVDNMFKLGSAVVEDKVGIITDAVEEISEDSVFRKYCIIEDDASVDELTDTSS